MKLIYWCFALQFSVYAWLPQSLANPEFVLGIFLRYLHYSLAAISLFLVVGRCRNYCYQVTNTFYSAMLRIERGCATVCRLSVCPSVRDVQVP